MFQVDHEINSYNSLIMNQTSKVGSKFNKTYSSSKLLNSNDLSTSKNKNQILSEKKDIHNANLNLFNTDNTSNKNMKNLTQKQSEESTLKNVKKLPKILKYTIQTNSLLDSKCGDSSHNNNRIISVSNHTEKIIKDDMNSHYNRRNLILKEEFKDKPGNNQLDRKNSLRLSDTTNLECIKKILMPSNLNKNKKSRTKKEINFGKMKEYIKLPEFIGEEPLTEIIF